MKNQTLSLIWDFDGPIGMINSTYPYNFDAKVFDAELKNVSDILDVLDWYKLKACFAITGFGAEESGSIFEIRDLIREISTRGHEIASHSWKHENFAKLSVEQARRSLRRSKLILESCLEASVQKELVGFVPPHNRPMTWISKGRLSLGDNRLFPFVTTGDVTGIIRLLAENRYGWIRISGRSLKARIMRSPRVYTKTRVNGITILDQHITGFGPAAINLLHSKNVVDHLTVSAHPLMWSATDKHESKGNFERFLDKLLQSGFNIVRPMDIVA